MLYFANSIFFVNRSFLQRFAAKTRKLTGLLGEYFSYEKS